MLRLPVKVNSITNLTDARFCAGMGVEMLGFSMSEKHERHIKTDKANGITGWLSGVKVVSECYFGEKSDVLVDAAKAVSAEVIEIDAIMYKPNSISDFNLILRLSVAEWETVKGVLPENALLHLMLEKSDLENISAIQEISESQSTLLNVSKLDLSLVDNLLSKVPAYGISIDGGNEISPGISDFDHLAEVLEYLEA
jgi:phosphoribosylanthranilate isomerase